MKQALIIREPSIEHRLLRRLQTRLDPRKMVLEPVDGVFLEEDHLTREIKPVPLAEMGLVNFLASVLTDCLREELGIHDQEVLTVLEKDLRFGMSKNTQMHLNS